MARTYRKDHRGRNYRQLVQQAERDWDERVDSWGWRYMVKYYGSLKQQIGKIGTDSTNYGWCHKKSLKWHTNYERRRYERDELSKSYRDWDHDFDRKIDFKVKRLVWCYD